MAEDSQVATSMATHESLDSEMRHISIASPTDPTTNSDSSFLRRQSHSSSDSSWQSSAAATTATATTTTTRCHTPDSPIHSNDFEPEASKPRWKSTVIHEEEVESSSSAATRDSSTPLPAPASAAAAATTPPESPVLPPVDTITAPSKPRRVLQPVEHALPYSHADMPWDKFYSSRADYPRSMFDMFLAYHRGPLDTLHDLGAGSGLAADGLLTALRGGGGAAVLPRTILSDPGEENMGITTRFVTARHPGLEVECWQARGEDQDQFLVPSSVDMTICAEALHWMDMPSAISQVAHSLRPGGTFAVVLYSCFPRILNNARAKKALRALVEYHLGSSLFKEPPHNSSDSSNNSNNSCAAPSPASPPPPPNSTAASEPSSPSSVQMHPHWARGMRALTYGLDAVELPADQWEDIKRHEINCGAAGWWWPSTSKDTLGCATPMADASPHERLVYESYEDWGRGACGVRELKELLMSIQVGFGETTWESALWQELERSVKGPLHFVWQVHMIMARKKKSLGLQTRSEESEEL